MSVGASPSALLQRNRFPRSKGVERRSGLVIGVETECASESSSVLVGSTTQLLAIENGTEAEAYRTGKPL